MGHRGAETWVVDRLVEFVDDDAGADQPRAQFREQRGVGLGVPEGGSLDVDGAHAPVVWKTDTS